MAEDRVPCFGGTLPANVVVKSVNRDELLERLLPLLSDRSVLRKHHCDTLMIDQEIQSILFLLGG